ncbi:uncharacterized protein [Atheta coriaria]|uniref:uncharacterized protein isoform X4 n=1 Tax=Dalotia coriaria TaxID=877792 RepID=UPI0031F39F2E
MGVDIIHDDDLINVLPGVRKMKNEQRTFVLGTIPFCVVLVLSTLTSPSRADCPVNFLQLHNKCYYFSRDVEQWSDSHYRCAAFNSTLVTLKSKHNNKKLVEYLRQENLATKEWWIGARYDWKQRQWQWGATGKPVKFNHFVRDLAQKTKLEWHCAFLDQRQQYKWNADPCTRKKYFICMQNDLDYHEEEHLKNELNGDNQPAFIMTGMKPLKPKGNLRPGRPQQRYACPKGYGSVRNSCYKFSKTQATWQEAYFACTDESNGNGTLAIIPDKKYDRGLRRYAKRIGAKAHERWIGGIYDWQTTAWKWAANGVIIQHKEKDKDVLHWHCLIFSPLLTDKWTSDQCTIRKYYICQTAPQVYVPMEMNRRPGAQNKVNVKEGDGQRRKDKFDYSVLLEFRRNMTHREQQFHYKQNSRQNKSNAAKLRPLLVSPRKTDFSQLDERTKM